MPEKIKILAADDVALVPFENLSKSRYKLVQRAGISNDSILNDHYDVILIRSTRKIDRDFIDRFTGKVIATLSKGTDHIDLEYCKEKNIKVFNAETGNSRSAAEHTFAMILAASKNLILSDEKVRKGKFGDNTYKRSELYGKKLGIIGYGSIGKIIEGFGKIFGMDVYANDTNPAVVKKNKSINFKSLNYILSNCDIITVHIPLNEKNKNFLNLKKLSLLKTDAILVNTSRGEIIDEEALLGLLKEGKIRFVCLDVFKNEPDINSLFFKFDNVILSNHIAGKTPESKEKIAKEVCEKINNHFGKK